MPQVERITSQKLVGLACEQLEENLVLPRLSRNESVDSMTSMACLSHPTTKKSGCRSCWSSAFTLGTHAKA